MMVSDTQQLHFLKKIGLILPQRLSYWDPLQEFTTREITEVTKKNTSLILTKKEPSEFVDTLTSKLDPNGAYVNYVVVDHNVFVQQSEIQLNVTRNQYLENLSVITKRRFSTFIDTLWKIGDEFHRTELKLTKSAALDVSSSSSASIFCLSPLMWPTCHFSICQWVLFEPLSVYRYENIHHADINIQYHLWLAHLDYWWAAHWVFSF